MKKRIEKMNKFFEIKFNSKFDLSMDLVPSLYVKFDLTIISLFDEKFVFKKTKKSYFFFQFFVSDF